MASINKLMKQAMRAQQQAQEVESKLAAQTVEASSGGGAVKVVATCKGEVKSIKIDPETLDPEDVESLEDMVLLREKEAATAKRWTPELQTTKDAIASGGSQAFRKYAEGRSE